ncbi:uncharacterized protein LOC130732490 [Lotus japonicus]|uniref:uncharacterized protein LOC130732490 n=1 Tax=Lotus japonicus TaxID=34305 RepID=UPI002584CB13|nr:uncharacterized protein LOC130732490 [Lotus japonicus]
MLPLIYFYGNYSTSRLALHGIDADLPLAEAVDSDHVPVITLEDEFLKLYPRKDIRELNDTAEDGIFIVMANISGLVEGEKWWYSACSCHKAVTVEDGISYCPGCSKVVLSVTPRFRIKLEVDDGLGCGVFVVFDTDCQQLLSKTCKELIMASKGKAAKDYPNEIKSIIGRQILFKVQKSNGHGTTFDDSYKVKKICTDVVMVENFKDNSRVQTPTKMISSPKFSKFSGAELDNNGDSSAKLSEIGPSVVSLDEISPTDGSVICSSVQSAGSDLSSNKPAKRLRIRPVKLEKDYAL